MIIVSFSSIQIAVFNKAKSAFGRIDVVINNAGILNENQWRRMIEVNVVSTKCYFLIPVLYYIYYVKYFFIFSSIEISPYQLELGMFKVLFFLFPT